MLVLALHLALAQLGVLLVELGEVLTHDGHLASLAVGILPELVHRLVLRALCGAEALDLGSKLIELVGFDVCRCVLG